MISSRASLCILIAALPLAACQVRSDDPAKQAANTSSASDGVARVETPAPDQPPVVTMPETVVIQSQPGPQGAQVDLLKVAVTGDILTVTLRCVAPEKYNTKLFKLDEVSVIDDATSQRIGVLKDSSGKWMASALTGDNMTVPCTTPPGIMWAKFPAPPATSPTISINLPGVAPFDGVPVTR